MEDCSCVLQDGVTSLGIYDDVAPLSFLPLPAVQCVCVCVYIYHGHSSPETKVFVHGD